MQLTPMAAALAALAVLLIPAPRPRAGGTHHRMPHGRRRSDDADPALAWLLALAGELRGGSDPLRALRVCGARYPVAPTATRTASLGGDVARALRRDARTTPVLRSVSAAWAIADQTGSGLAGVLDSIADGHRRTQEVRRSLRVELAGPRATARLMSLLPLLGLGLAFLLGADPLSWLITSPVGVLCLTTAVVLNVAGYWWITRIVRGIEESL